MSRGTEHLQNDLARRAPSIALSENCLLLRGEVDRISAGQLQPQILQADFRRQPGRYPGTHGSVLNKFLRQSINRPVLEIYVRFCHQRWAWMNLYVRAGAGKLHPADWTEITDRIVFSAVTLKIIGNQLLALPLLLVSFFGSILVQRSQTKAGGLGILQQHGLLEFQI